MLGPLGQIGQVTVGELDHPALHVAPGKLDEVMADGVADAAAARVQHHPHPAGFVETDLDEVIAAAQGADLVDPVGEAPEGLEQLRVLVGHRIERRREGLGRVGQRTLVLVLRAPDRHVAADLVEDLLQHALVELLGAQRGPRGGHAATDVDADSGRDDRLIGGDDAADGGADAGVHVRHRGDMAMDEGQLGQVDQLRARARVQLIGPDLDRLLALGDDLLDGHASSCRLLSGAQWQGR